MNGPKPFFKGSKLVKRLNLKSPVWLAIPLILSVVTAAAGEEMKLLWQIGKDDNDTAELALGPQGYNQFDGDGLFLVGHSNPKTDWPYAHPGPDDFWAGGRAHAFSILFGLKETLIGGQCRLVVDLVDTHDVNPPKLEVEINGHKFTHETPKGGPDASIVGDPSAGREHRFAIAFPSRLLVPGLNRVTITNAQGSWVLYDWLGLEIPPRWKAVAAR